MTKGANFFHSPLSASPRTPLSANDPDRLSGEKKNIIMKNSNSSHQLLELLLQELESMLIENQQHFSQNANRIHAWMEIVKAVLKTD
jgi:hypothetical protein